MCAQRVSDMGIGKMHEFTIRLDKAGFDADLIQKVIESKNNEMAKAMLAAISTGEEPVLEPENPFTLLSAFTLTVPSDYVHTTQLTTFREKHGKDFGYFNPDLTDDHSQNVSVQLTPGQQLEARIFGIKSGKTVSSQECLDLLEREYGLLVGAQGLSLVHQLLQDQFPVDKWILSFDLKNHLWKDSDGGVLVPSLDRGSDGDRKFYLGDFEFAWDAYCAVLVLRNVQNSPQVPSIL